LRRCVRVQRSAVYATLRDAGVFTLPMPRRHSWLSAEYAGLRGRSARQEQPPRAAALSPRCRAAKRVEPAGDAESQERATSRRAREMADKRR